MLKKWRKFLWGVLGLLFLVIAGVVFRIYFLKPEINSLKIGWISDIHADRFKHRQVDSGMLYPRQYEDYLPRVFKQLKQDGIYAVIATGDNTNSGDDNYARDLVEIAKKEKMQVIWVKGNHDNDEVMDILGVTGRSYYFKDYGETRIIILDNNDKDSGNYYGKIDEEQLVWLREALKTDKAVIVTMHIPIFSPDNLELLDQYSELERVLSGSENVAMVLSGHWHKPWQKQYNGLSYYGQGALTREGEEGAYAMVDLKNMSLNYLFAK